MPSAGCHASGSPLSIGIQALGQVSIGVADLDRAISFYRDTLGLRFLFRAPPGLAFFDCGGVRLMLDAPLGADKGSSILYFKVADIAAEFARLEAGGAEILAQPHKIADMPDYALWMGFFKDSEGNTLALMAERPRSS